MTISLPAMKSFSYKKREILNSQRYIHFVLAKIDFFENGVSITWAKSSPESFRYSMHHCSVLQCVAVWCSVVQCGAVCCSVLQCVAVCCSVLHCVAVCCSVSLIDILKNYLADKNPQKSKVSSLLNRSKKIAWIMTMVLSFCVFREILKTSAR